MRKSSSAALLLLLTVGVPSLMRAQSAHPDFTGSFTFDPAQSEAGQFMPTKLSQKVVQSGNKMVIDRAQTTQMGETTATLTYALDGTPSANELTMGGAVVKISTVVTWEGSTPVFTSKFSVGDTDVYQTDRWTLGDGGKKLLITRNINASGQEMAAKLVLVRQ